MAATIHCPTLFDGRALRTGALLSIAGGKVEALSFGMRANKADIRLPEETVVAPGLVDIQVNGGGGALFNDDPSVATIATIAAAHRPHGVTSMLPTLITDTRASIARAVAAARDACGQVPGIAGVHLEGPFLNPARKGTHDASRIAMFGDCEGGADGDLALLTALGDGGRSLITLAPECVPAGTIRALKARGAIVFAGHTDATAREIDAALGEGLDGFTHLFNAMSQMTPREPGVVGAALTARRAVCGLILDGHHVAAGNVAVLNAARGLDRIALVSDAMTPAGTDATSFHLQGKTIRVENGRCVGPDGTLAGAAITLADAVRIAIADYGFTAEEALASATRIPAEVLGRNDIGRLAPGARADLVVFAPGWRLEAVMQGGVWARELEAA
jgi:N-acetylglucosamine-6-phosphate deacetylase